MSEPSKTGVVLSIAGTYSENLRIDLVLFGCDHFQEDVPQEPSLSFQPIKHPKCRSCATEAALHNEIQLLKDKLHRAEGRMETVKEAYND